MTQEALKLALEALEANDQLINGTGTNGGLVYCMDGYYSDCFDVDPINKQTEEAITAIKEALAKEKALQALHSENERLGLYKDAYAEPEQEPVKMIAYNCFCGRTMKFESVHGVVAPQRTWVGLTDEEFDDLRDNNFGVSPLISAVEAKLKERNG